MIVSLEAARALKEAGYPQDWDHRWYDDDDDLRCRDDAGWPWGDNPCAAPDSLTALMWLETEKGWHWQHTMMGVWRAYQAETHTNVPDGLDEFDTPNALILAICEQLK